MKERVQSPHAKLSTKHQDKSRVKNHVDRPRSVSSLEVKQKADCGSVQPKGNYESRAVRGNASAKNDELVKYMSDVPGYLQRVETGVNFQEKVLNVGVLDWSRLEKWNHNQEIIPARGGKNASSSTGESLQKMSAGSMRSREVDQSKPPAHRVKPSSQKVTRIQDSGTGSRSTFDGQKMACKYKSFSRNSSDGKSNGKGLDQKITSETGNSLPNSGTQGPYRLEKSVRARHGNVRRKEEEMKRCNLYELAPDMGASSSKLRNNGTSLSTEEKISAKKSNTKMRVVEFRESAIDLGHPGCPSEPKNIVLILPRKYPQNSLQQNRTFMDGESKEVDHNKSPGGFSPGEAYSSGVPHSCSLPSMPEPDLLPHSQINAQSMELPCGASKISPRLIMVPRILIQGKHDVKNELNVKSMNSNFAESPQVLDQASNGRTEREARSQTPNRRFSFGLARMSRSFSLKEGLAVPQLSSASLSAKSGPVRSEASYCSDALNKEKQNLHNRAKSSPLRRLLDPFLKSKVATSPHSAEIARPSKVINLSSSSLRSSNASESPTESFDNEKPVGSMVQAFLQLTIKNGLPLFRFVADNNNHVLAATMRNFTTPEKDDSSENFTFYSVNEIKKKIGGWMNQGSKEKKCEYIYNVLGQMKVSTSTHHSSSSSGLNSNKHVIRESVLFGAELQPEEHDSTKSTTQRELAAVVVKIPSNDYQDLNKDSTKWFPEDNEDYAGTVALLTGGLHSFPEKGAPSPLIDRWRSGGSCDCGGWDIGCKLRILSNHDQNKFPGISLTCPIQERFELFVQEGTQQDGPIFSLAPIKNGVYSIAFGASISLLQAFFISVAVLNSQKFPDPSTELHQPVSNGYDGVKTPPCVQDKVPALFSPNPPLSPVGRV